MTRAGFLMLTGLAAYVGYECESVKARIAAQPAPAVCTVTRQVTATTTMAIPPIAMPVFVHALTPAPKKHTS